MKTLVVYDSAYGNTERIARAIGDALAGEVSVLPTGEVSSREFEGLDLLIVGSPTYGGRPTQAMQDFLDSAPAAALKGINVAAFDTRLPAKWVAIFGYAAGKIASRLERNGGTLVVPPEGFVVKGTKGPLGEGELERAAGWAEGVAAKTGNS